MAVGSMLKVDMICALVRPIAVLYSVVVLSILAFMAMSGCSMPADGVGANCVNALITIAGIVTVEYSIERGIRHYLDERKK